MLDARNILDTYKYWETDAIKADLRTKCNNFSVLVQNTIRDFNLGSVIRSANAFCARDVIVYGDKQYDRRSTVGAHHYMNMKHVKFVDELDVLGSVVIGIDNIPSAKPIETYEWPRDKHVVMVFGEENIGINKDLLALCRDVVYIKQYGSVRSLNVGVASGIAMFHYMLGVKNEINT